MHAVDKLIRSRRLIHDVEDLDFFFCDVTELTNPVLELKFSRMRLVDDFLADLSVDWDVNKARLIV